MRDFIKKVSILFIILFLSVPLALMGQLLGSAAANEGGSAIEVGGNTKITQNGCSRKIEKTEKNHERKELIEQNFTKHKLSRRDFGDG